MAPKPKAEVLCAEAHPACVRLVAEALREFADVHGVGSVQRALAELESCTPTLLLLYLDLPDGEGLQVLDAMCRDSHLHAVPVLVISAIADAAVFDEARWRGAQACLAKPVDLAQSLALTQEGQGQ